MGRYASPKRGTKLSRRQRLQRVLANWASTRANRGFPQRIRLRTIHHDPEGTRLNARKFAFSVLTSGANFAKVSDVFLMHGIILPSRSRLYAVQKEFFGPIRDHCLKQCQHWREQMAYESVVAFDGAWSHRRCAKECIVILIDCGQKRIVDFEIVLKSKPGVVGGYDGSSNGMELFGVQKIIQRWKGDPKVRGCVHDNDSKATKAIADADWHIEQMYDPNHIVKQFERRWNSCNTRLLRGLHAKLLMWFRYLIRSDFTVQEKRCYWMNSLEHFKGNHAKCPRQHPAGDPLPQLAGQEGQRQLREVLTQTVELLSRARTGFDTQLNESCNSLKAKFADKNTSWRCSWSSRVMCALMQVNSVDNWRIELAGLCRVTLSDEVRQRLNDRWRIQQQLQAVRGTPEYRLRECRRRWEDRNKNRLKRAGIAHYSAAVPTGSADATGDPEPDDPITPYEDALRTDWSIEAPGEEGDDSVEIVRNRSRPAPPSRRTSPPLPSTGGPPGGTSGAADDTPGNEVEHDPDEEEDDHEHIEALQTLPPGVPISDDTFDIQGTCGSTLIMCSRYRRPSTGGDGPGDSPDQDLEAIESVSSDSDDEREVISWPPFGPGTVLFERSTHIRLVFVVPSASGLWVMLDEEREHLRYMLPEELERLESVPGE
jgi:hypothetical protein